VLTLNPDASIADVFCYLDPALFAHWGLALVPPG
jgi:hypothetical protein